MHNHLLNLRKFEVRPIRGSRVLAFSELASSILQHGVYIDSRLFLISTGTGSFIPLFPEKSFLGTIPHTHSDYSNYPSWSRNQTNSISFPGTVLIYCQSFQNCTLGHIPTEVTALQSNHDFT